jgi:succinate dehydrogenase/fumarate reductase flavoprotein subunit
MLDVASTVAAAAEAREESRGAHQRLDFAQRDDERFLRHSLVSRSAGGLAVNWRPVTITRSQPGVRNYSGKVPV